MATVFDELGVLRPDDGLRIDLELGHRFFVRPLLVGRHMAAAR